MWDMLGSIAEVILRHHEGCLVEIGMGRSTSVLAGCAKKTGRILYSCDIVKHNQLFDRHSVFTGTSFSFMEKFKAEPVIVFLDGCHKEAVVRKEFTFFLELLADGGVIFLHDTLPPTKRHLNDDRCSDSYKVRKELEGRSDLDCFTWSYTAKGCGLTMVQRRPKCIVDQL